MQDKREYILQKSFETFMAKGYDSCSMTVLQKELKIARGGMYRYFESKDALFRAVVDKYFWGMIDFISPYFSDDMTLLERIEQSNKSMKQIAQYIDQISGIEGVFLNYTALIIQAAKHYPGFIDRMKKRNENEYKRWIKSIENSIEKGEVRKDVNVKLIALIYIKAVDGSENMEGDKRCFKFSQTVDSTRKMMEYIYTLIKA